MSNAYNININKDILAILNVKDTLSRGVNICENTHPILFNMHNIKTEIELTFYYKESEVAKVVFGVHRIKHLKAEINSVLSKLFKVRLYDFISMFGGNATYGSLAALESLEINNDTDQSIREIILVSIVELISSMLGEIQCSMLNNQVGISLGDLYGIEFLIIPTTCDKQYHSYLLDEFAISEIDGVSNTEMLSILDMAVKNPYTKIRKIMLREFMPILLFGNSGDREFRGILTSIAARCVEAHKLADRYIDKNQDCYLIDPLELSDSTWETFIDECNIDCYRDKSKIELPYISYGDIKSDDIEDNDNLIIKLKSLCKIRNNTYILQRVDAECNRYKAFDWRYLSGLSDISLYDKI